MRNSIDDVDFVVNAVGNTLDQIPDTVNVLSVFLGLQILLRAYVETMAGVIVLPSEVVELGRQLDFCVQKSTCALVELDSEWNGKN